MAFGNIHFSVPVKSFAFIARRKKIQIMGMVIRIMNVGRPLIIFHHLCKILSAGSIKQNCELGPGVCGHGGRGGLEVGAEIKTR